MLLISLFILLGFAGGVHSSLQRIRSLLYIGRYQSILFYLILTTPWVLYRHIINGDLQTTDWLFFLFVIMSLSKFRPHGAPRIGKNNTIGAFSGGLLFVWLSASPQANFVHALVGGAGYPPTYWQWTRAAISAHATSTCLGIIIMLLHLSFISSFRRRMRQQKP